MDGFLDKLVQRLSCDTVEHVHKVQLARLQYRGNRATVDLHVNENWRRRHVPVRCVVMNELVEPFQFASLRVECDDRIAVQIAAVDRAVGVACRAEHQTRGLVGREIRPDVATASILPRVAGPILVVRLARPRNGVKRPHELSGRRIPRADVTARLRRRQFAGPRAGDQKILVDRYRIRNGERVPPVFRNGWRRDAHVHIDFAALSESIGEFTGLDVEPHQIALVRREEETRAERIATFPVRETAAVNSPRRLVLPDDLAIFRLESRHGRLEVRVAF